MIRPVEGDRRPVTETARSPVTCARCGLTFTPDWSDEDAVAEALSLWGVASIEGKVDAICDDCFEPFMAWARGQGLVVAEEAGDRPPLHEADGGRRGD